MSGRAQPDFSGASELAESFTRFADKIMARQNDTLAQISGTLLTYDSMVKGLAGTIGEQAATIKAQGAEIAGLQRSDLERAKFVAEIELKRAEMEGRERRSAAIIGTLREVGGSVVQQVVAGRMLAAATPAAEPAVAIARPEQGRPIAAVLAEIWARLSDETIERLQQDAGIELVHELLTEVSGAMPQGEEKTT
ncbi:hypothetical protein [Polyangium sorediatum]|uniref:Uncharacterized protein n=1 Tax=Polyangium sorediatum TaxID=889274 RepID=A0ABT6NLB2_9BACT|nr:hypothetical protein [Polyangium sorediatum]MDI1429032.1 hypothetical protein [Polyangium sorediatum]